VSALLIDLRISFMNLVEHGRRTALLSVAIAAVTCLFVLMTAMASGIHATLIDSATTLATGDINIGGFFKDTPGSATAIVADYEAIADLARRELPELDFVAARGRGLGKIVADDGSSLQAVIGGIDIHAEPGFRRILEVSSGDVGQLSEPNGLLVFEQQAQRLGLKVGDAVTLTGLTTHGVANTIDCHVVAIAHDVGLLSGFAIFISSASLRQLYQLRPNVTGVLQIHLKPGHRDHLDKLVERLQLALRKAGYRVMDYDPRSYFQKLMTITREEWTGQKLDVSTWEDELSLVSWTFPAFQALSVVLMVILLAIMVVGIMNTLWIAIRERTREIGTLRAIGMQRGGVLRLFLLEAMQLGVLGASVGVIAGALLTWLINIANLQVPLSVQLLLMSSTLHLALDVRTLVVAVLLITSVTGFAALYPALRAARQRPVNAMAHFG
jgi:ABC-type lipoprotein release transport system permease subunit